MIMFIVNFIAQAFAHSTAMKKGAGIGAGAGLILGLAYGASVEYTNQQTALLRNERTDMWSQHRREGDIILKNLNETLTDLKSSTHRIETKTDYLYKREIEKK